MRDHAKVLILGILSLAGQLEVAAQRDLCRSVPGTGEISGYPVYNPPPGVDFGIADPAGCNYGDNAEWHGKSVGTPAAVFAVAYCQGTSCCAHTRGYMTDAVGGQIWHMCH